MFCLCFTTRAVDEKNIKSQLGAISTFFTTKTFKGFYSDTIDLVFMCLTIIRKVESLLRYTVCFEEMFHLQGKKKKTL